MNLRVAVGVCVVMAAACSGGGGGSSSGGSSSGSSGTSSSSSSGGGQGDARAFVENLYKALCSWDERCAATAGRRYSTQAACEADAARYADLLVPLIADQFTLGTQAQLDACTQEVAAVACDGSTNTMGPACHAALVTSAPVAAGGVCRSPADPDVKACVEGSFCSYQDSGCGHCVARVASGGTCTPGDSCADQTFCSEGHCIPLLARGAPCTGYGQCLGNLVCSGPDGQQHCADRVGSGTTCTQYGNDCFMDLTCTGTQGDMHCTAFLAENAACTWTSEPPCMGYCVFPSLTATAGTCHASAPLPTAGQPCLDSAGYPVCGTGTYPQQTEDGSGQVTACECRPLKETSAACLSSGECLTGICDGVNYATTPPTPGACAAKHANGDPCSYSGSDCVSGYCDTTGSSHVCAAPPACQ